MISHQLRSQNILFMLWCVFRADQPGILRRWKVFWFWVFIKLLGVNTGVSPRSSLNSRALDKDPKTCKLLPVLFWGGEKKAFPLPTTCKNILIRLVRWLSWWKNQLCQPDNLNSDPHVKNTAVHSCNPSTPVGRWEVEAPQASYPGVGNIAARNKRPCLKTERERWLLEADLGASIRILRHTNACNPTGIIHI